MIVQFCINFSKTPEISNVAVQLRVYVCIPVAHVALSGVRELLA